LALSIRKWYEWKDSQGREEKSGEERDQSLFFSLAISIAKENAYLR
jgi:hypothetical protein